VLWGLVLAVLLLHALLLLVASAPLEVRLAGASPASSVQLRVVPPAPPALVPPVPARPRKLARAAAPAAVPATPASAPEPAPVSEPMPTAEAGAEASAPTPVAEAAAPAAQASAPVPANGSEQAALTEAAAMAWPLIPLGSLPPSRLLSYQLTGMDKGLTYYASGELRWQHNDTAYELTLSVRAFLLGSRHWRSRGTIGATGLAPGRFSDSWRNERAAHFDREQQRIVFSSNSTPAALEPGAQDQVSLYVQLAAAMAGEPERFVPGTRLQVQTATIRDAVPWSMVLQGLEPLVLDGQTVQAARWICQPRNQYEARVEFWVTQAQAWLPVRIRITQSSGSYIDLLWRGTEPLPPLPVAGDSPGPPAGS
jgi:hypothetical protein